MAVSLVISYYKNIPNLHLILQGLSKQSNTNFEVIIAEDDANTETSDYMGTIRLNYNFLITHLNQNEDLGFRKNSMLNKAIVAAQHDLMVFIDGDCIPHKHFIKNYLNANPENTILSGRRVMLSEKISQLMWTKNTLANLGFSHLLLSSSTKSKEGIYFPWFKLSFKKRGLLGCNWGVLKSNLLLVNGFDEDYTSPGVGEDVDIEWRLKEHGLEMVSMKNKSIVYHLHHKRSYGEDKVAENYQKLAKKKKNDQIVCLNGIRKLMDYTSPKT
jgi:GT2 family glycosyltransferase